MSKKSYNNFREEFLITKCIPLDDPFECDVDRNPLIITKDCSVYNKFGYEIYKIRNDGRLFCIKTWDNEIISDQ